MLQHSTLMQSIVLLFCLCSRIWADTGVSSPSWANQPPTRTIKFNSKAADSLQRGKELADAVRKLQPGDELRIGSGVYSVDRLWDISCSGTANAPIRICADKNASVAITRPDNQQNVVNVGMSKPVQYLVLQGLEITGGSHGVRLGACSDLWIDHCHIHHTSEVCLSANSKDTQRIYITSNVIHHPGGTAEGMYLGGNDGSVVMSESVIVGNLVYECRGTQGDGIELKQGSWGNLIARNKVYDCNYPCITVYGTNGKAQNVIERNLCFRSQDAAMQVQGEAVVRNNILIGGGNGAFVSTDHQGKTVNLQVIHNTIINTGHAFRGGSWNARDQMVLANNIIYSKEQNAFHFPNGASKVEIFGNVVVGQGDKFGSKIGNGIEDFVRVSWVADELNEGKLNVAPRSIETFSGGSKRYMLAEDYLGKPRSKSAVISGAISIAP